MSVTMYAHLPGVQLDDGASGFVLGPGRVESLAFERWLELDDQFKYVERKYERSRPAFWVGELTVSDPADKDDVLAAAASLLGCLHAAFLLEPRTPLLPTPLLSARYVVLPPPPKLTEVVTSLTMRAFGPMEREWIVFGSPLVYRYDRTSLAAVREAYVLLDVSSAAGASAGVEAAIETLERTARPDSWWGGEETLQRASEFVQCIAACESVLLPPAEERAPGTLTETFGQHGAALVARSPDGLAALSAEIADFYRLRSRLVHGRVGLHDLDEVQARRLAAGRALLRAVILGAMALGRSGKGVESLPRLLSEALSGASTQAALACGVRGERSP